MRPPTLCCSASRPAVCHWPAGWPADRSVRRRRICRSAPSTPPSTAMTCGCAASAPLGRDGRACRRDHRRAGDPGRRRLVLRAHDPRRARRASRDLGPPARRPTGGAGRSRPPASCRSAPTTSARTSPPSVGRDRAGHARAETDGTRRGHLLRARRARMKRHLLSAADLDRDGAVAILDTAERLDRDRRARGEEAAAAARPDGGEPVLRGLDPYPDLVRARGQAAVRRRGRTSARRARASRRGESLKDTALTLEAMGADAVVIRHSYSGAPHRLAGWVRRHA